MGSDTCSAAQVAVAQRGAAAADSLGTLLPELQLAATASAQAIRAGQADAPAATPSSTAALGTHELARRQAQASVIHNRFVAKLRGCTKTVPSQQPVEGRTGSDTDGSQRQLSVSQQVSALVQEATSLDNLSRMYEGWSAWI